MAQLQYENVGAYSFQWQIDDLQYQFNETNYIRVVLVQGNYGFGTYNIPDEAIVDQRYAPKSGTNYYSGWEDHEDMRYYGYERTFWGYTQTPASGKYFYVGEITLVFPGGGDATAPDGLKIRDPEWNSDNNTWEVTFQWDRLSNADKYKVYLNSDYIGSTTSNTKSIYDLKPDTTYTFGVKAKVNGNWSSTATISYRTKESLSYAPPKVKLTIKETTETSVTFSWDISDNIGLESIWYILSDINDRYITGGNPSFNKGDNENDGNHTFSGLNPGTKYKLTLGARNLKQYYASEAKVFYTLQGNFEWDSAKISGNAFNITASEWSRFQEAINFKRNNRGLSYYDFSKFYTGNTFSSDAFNQVITAINQIYTHIGTSTQIAPEISGGVNTGDIVYAWYFNNLRDALNNA